MAWGVAEVTIHKRGLKSDRIWRQSKTPPKYQQLECTEQVASGVYCTYIGVTCNNQLGKLASQAS